MLSPIKSRNISSASFSFGASLTMLSVIPVNSVIFALIGFSGFTKVVNFSVTSPFLIFTAPISVIFSVFALSPVVSKSKHTNSSSKPQTLSPFTAETKSFTKYASTP